MVFFVIAVGFFYALPNLYGEDPALQISGTHGVELDQKTVDSIKNTLQSKNIDGKYEFAMGWFKGTTDLYKVPIFMRLN